MELASACTAFRELYEKKGLFLLVSHLDADGLSSAAIFAALLLKGDQPFQIRIEKRLRLEQLEQFELGKGIKALVLLDFSAKLEQLQQLTLKLPVFVLDHHRLETKPALPNLFFIHDESISASGISYFFARQLGLSQQAAQLALLGLIGDQLEEPVSKLGLKLIEEACQAGMSCQPSPPLFSSQRPLHRSLNLSPEIALTFLKEAGIQAKKEGSWRCLADLNEDELSRLVTALSLKAPKELSRRYYVRLANKFWDARELSTLLNALGRLGQPAAALELLLGRCDEQRLEQTYAQYRNELLKALRLIQEDKVEKIEQGNYLVVNFEDKLRDTLIGTVMSILAASTDFELLIGMVRSEGKLKVSCRTKAADAYLLLKTLAKKVALEDMGGHQRAAGCLANIEADKLIAALRCLPQLAARPQAAAQHAVQAS